ncbi:MAG: GntR family transcriptional regulator [Chloroflexota bacterium]
MDAGQAGLRDGLSPKMGFAPGVISSELDKPLYIQIQEYLAEKIFSGELAPETRLPSERELSRELEISRMTVRRAITELVNEGLLTRRHGSGTYVAKPRVSYEARELVSYTQAMRARGIAVGSQLLEFSQVPASRRLAERLQVEIGHALYHVARLRLANRVPTILERCFLSCERTPGLEEYNLEKTSIHDVLTAGYGVRIARVTQTIEAVTASDILAKQLRVEEGFPLLMISRTIHRAGDGKPILYSQDFLRSDYARIHFELEGWVGQQRTPAPSSDRRS